MISHYSRTWIFSVCYHWEFPIAYFQDRTHFKVTSQNKKETIVTPVLLILRFSARFWRQIDCNSLGKFSTICQTVICSSITIQLMLQVLIYNTSGSLNWFACSCNLQLLSICYQVAQLGQATNSVICMRLATARHIGTIRLYNLSSLISCLLTLLACQISFYLQPSYINFSWNQVASACYRGSRG